MSKFASPAIQAINLIRYIGDEVLESGRPIDQLSGISEIIGSPSEELADQILEELHQRGLVSMGDPVKMPDGTSFVNISLTLDGEDRSGIMRREGKKRSAPLLQDFNCYPNPLWIGLWQLVLVKVHGTHHRTTVFLLLAYRTVFFVSFSCLNVAENGSSFIIQISSPYCIRGTREVPVSGASAAPIRAFPQG